eukprot:TRINITY_DN5682_c0_g1_i1.p1 TRINITY_DN5682_c0_g1~~TRINITY_DN5682_c0_g1_i1.p1  ORF type:complete len:873 (-),score=170.73 TRINITY_DN5682_c0_g1_i1:8-2626(-)
MTQDIKGLTKGQVNDVRDEYGFNETPEKKKHWLFVVLGKFVSPTAVLLEVAAVVSVLDAFVFGFRLESMITAIVIVLLVFVNMTMGIWEEIKAAKAVAKLKERLQLDARVLRDDVWAKLPARELVPGDVISLMHGDIVSADVDIVKGELAIDQSALTGETELFTKVKKEEVFSGSIVKRGEAIAKVTKTGIHTYYGKTISLMESSSPKLHAEKITSEVAVMTLIIVIIALVVTVIFEVVRVLLLQEEKFGDYLLQLLPLIIALLITGVPIALPAMFTITMSLGSQKLIKKQILVTRLGAIEDASSMTILCSDKTGTITKNILDVVDVRLIRSKAKLNDDMLDKVRFSESDIILFGYLASEEINDDPIDLAFIKAAEKNNEIMMQASEYTLLEFIPFEPENRRTIAILRCNDDTSPVCNIVFTTKGSVNVISKLCRMKYKQGIKNTISKIVDKNSSKGYRSLAVAVSDIITVDELPEDLYDLPMPKYHFVGIAALSDSPREDSKEVIEKLKIQGVKTIMLTGDATSVAKQIARQVALGPNVESMKVIKYEQEDTLSSIEMEEDFEYDIDFESLNGLAEVYPEDKYSIVKSLQKKGAIVGMTGDGVNDAPALKLAEVGIAVSNATDIAKSSASAILLEEGLSGILTLIKVGRKIHNRIATWIINKIIKSILNVVFIVIIYCIYNIFVVAPIHILILLFLVDFVTIAIAYDHTRGSKHPNEWHIILLTFVSGILGILNLVEMFGVFYIGTFALGYDLSQIHNTTTLTVPTPDEKKNLGSLQTYIFFAMFLLGILNVFSVRERRFFLMSRPGWVLIIISWIDIVIVIFISIFGIPSLVYPVLQFWHVFIELAYVILCLLFNDLCKVVLVEMFLKDY